MDDRDTEYIRTGPMPETTDELADLLGDWQRALAAELREQFPDYMYAIMSSVKVMDRTNPYAEPGTVIAFLPDDPRVALGMAGELAAAVVKLEEDPRVRDVP